MPDSPSSAAARLEHVRREIAGIEELSGFHERLMEEPPDLDGFSVSYAAVRNYHQGTDYGGKVRHPSYEYLCRVLKVFPDVRAEWLMRNQGEPTEEADAALRVRQAATDGAVDSGATPEQRHALEQRQRAVTFKWEVLVGLGFPEPELPEYPDAPDSDDINAFARAMEAWAGRANMAHLPHWIPGLLEVQRRTGRSGEKIGEALRGALVGMEPDFEVTDAMDRTYRLAPWLDDYITTMVPVLLSLEGVLADEPGARKWDRRTSGTVKRTWKTEGGDDGDEA